MNAFQHLKILCGVVGMTVVASSALPSTALNGEWRDLAGPPREDATAIYDPVRDRIVVFGGRDRQGSRNDVWAISLSGAPAWTRLVPGGMPPSARFGHSAVYDPVGDRMIVFGGRDNTLRNDVWGLSFAAMAWAAISPSGAPPAPRLGHAAVYDPAGDRVIVMGGADGNGYFSDAWSLSLVGTPAWSDLAPSGTLPGGRWKHALVFDSGRDRVLAFGGVGASSFNDVWALPLSGSAPWSLLVPSGSAPSARWNHAAIYDPVRDRMVTFGGFNGALFDDAWALTLSGTPAWSSFATPGTRPSARGEHAAIYDPMRDRMVVYGGSDGSVRGDVWRLSLTASPAWSVITPQPPIPPGRQNHSSIYDPARNRLLIFGGLIDPFTSLNDTWALTLGEVPTWSHLVTFGSAPSGRSGHSAIYDPVRDRMIVFGGSPTNQQVWQLRFPGLLWEQLFPLGTPPVARAYHSAIYDPVRDRMIVHGGHDGSNHLADTWALSLAGTPTWTPIGALGTAPAKIRHVAIYDPPRDRMVVWGGYVAPSGTNYALTLSGTPTWSSFGGIGAIPSAQSGCVPAYDAALDRLVVFGGTSGSSGTGVDGAYALSLADTRTWTLLSPEGAPPTPRYNHTGAYDPGSQRLIVFGGWDGSNRNDSWAFSLATPAVVSVPPSVTSAAAGLLLEGARPNPATDALRVSLVLPDARPARLEVFDIGGRRVFDRRLEGLGPGRHELRLEGRGMLAPGAYLLRLSQAGRAVIARAVVLR